MRPHFLLLPALGGLSFVSGLRNVTLDDNGSSIIYSPGWQVSNDVLDFGGSLHFSNDSTVSASLTFRGVAIYLLAPLWSSSVGAQVAIDGIAPTTIDLQDRGVPPEPGFGKETVASQVVWGASDLPNTKHSVVISLPQTKLMVVLDGLIITVPDEELDTLLRIPGVVLPELPSLTLTTTSSTTIQTTTTTSIVSSSSSSPSSTTSTFTTTSSSVSSSTRSTGISSRSTTGPRIPTASDFTPTPLANAGFPDEYPPPSSSSSSDVSGPSKVAHQGLSSDVKRTIVIAAAFGALMVLVVVVVLLLCCLRRLNRKRREEIEDTWSTKYTGFPSHAARIAARPVPAQQNVPTRPNSPSRVPAPLSPFNDRPSPITGSPFLPVPGLPARRLARSPLAETMYTAPSIPDPIHVDASAPPTDISISRTPSPTPRAPSPYSSPYAAPSSPLPPTPSAALIPITPRTPATPRVPRTPRTPETPWSANTSRFSGSSIASGSGYGWTSSLPSLVGIHPFSAPAAEDDAPPQHPTANANANAMRPDSDVNPPQISTDSKGPLPDAEAPVYAEKDRYLSAVGRIRGASNASDAPPPVYSPY